MKNLVLIFLVFVLLSSGSKAYGSNSVGEKKPAIVEEDKKKTEGKEDENEDVNYVAPKKVKADSAIHSISKYNFLFYMVYKIKYMSSDNNSSNTSPEE